MINDNPDANQVSKGSHFTGDMVPVYARKHCTQYNKIIKYYRKFTVQVTITLTYARENWPVFTVR